MGLYGYPRMLRFPFGERREIKRYASARGIERLLAGEVCVEEKLDGGIVSLERDGDDVICRGRRRIVLKNGFVRGRLTKAYKFLDKWYWENIEKIERIPDGHLFLGEWLYAMHNIFYDALPDWWICFDVFDGKRFLDRLDRERMLGYVGFECVPLLREGAMSLVDLEAMTALGKSAHGARMEGFVAKNYSEQLFIKYVDSEFDNDLELSEHWLKGPLEVNRLAGKD